MARKKKVEEPIEQDVEVVEVDEPQTETVSHPTPAEPAPTATLNDSTPVCATTVSKPKEDPFDNMKEYMLIARINIETCEDYVYSVGGALFGKYKVLLEQWHTYRRDLREAYKAHMDGMPFKMPTMPERID